VHDSTGLFNLLIVAVAVGYQVLKIWRKKSTTQAPQPVRTPLPRDEPETPWWEPEPTPVVEPTPAEEAAPLPKTTLARKTSLELKDVPAEAPTSERPPAYKPIAALSEIPTDPTPRAPATELPALRNLVLAQVVLSPPPGLRGGMRAGRSPLEIRR